MHEGNTHCIREILTASARGGPFIKSWFKNSRVQGHPKLAMKPLPVAVPLACKVIQSRHDDGLGDVFDNVQPTTTYHTCCQNRTNVTVGTGEHATQVVHHVVIP